MSTQMKEVDIAQVDLYGSDRVILYLRVFLK